ISDKADGSDWMNYDAFEQKAARHSQKFVRALVPLI
ncbi:MAG: 5'-methylthioadenosine/adenosylhomocysteine nucleosidase, partial [Duodenibacillus sp.]|nr:5'-methylthioadenosine/adenosylhomocysteine nucleosidase [Oscillospiraceae bacterium]MCF0254172.1 5'-methylthioadenosine/adenosylhomocysteine nucleosidase [Duodenibacillus sp.]